MKKIAIAIILFAICNNKSPAQTTNHDTLRKEFRKLLWIVENNYKDYHSIWNNNNYLTIRSSKGYFDFYSRSIMKDTINKLDFEVQIGYYTPKDSREKIKLFRENFVSVLDEYATENKWTKKYEERNLDKRQKRELGFMRSYDYYDSTGRKIISIFDRQKLDMAVTLYGYPVKNMAQYRSKKELENLAFEQITQIMSDKLEADIGGSGRYRHYKDNNIPTQKKAITAYDFEGAMRQAGFRYDAYSETNYIIVAYGFNLTDVKTLGREVKDDEKTTQISSFRDETESYSKEDKRIESAVKLYNLKIYILNLTSNLRNGGIVGVSSNDYQKMAIEVWVNLTKK
jgi:hypothetical protein